MDHLDQSHLAIAGNQIGRESISDWLVRVTNVDRKGIAADSDAVAELPIDTLHQCHCKQLPNG